MPLNADLNQALMLLGHKTLEVEQMKAQIENIVNEYNLLKDENERLKQELMQWQTGQNQQLLTSTATSLDTPTGD